MINFIDDLICKVDQIEKDDEGYDCGDMSDCRDFKQLLFA